MLGLSGLGQGWFGHSRTSSTQVSALHGLCTHSGQSPWHQQMLSCRNVISCPQISGFRSGILCFEHTRPSPMAQFQALAEPAQFLPASAELQGETPLHGIQPCPASASLPLTPSPPRANDDVPCSTSNSPLNLSCLLTQAESQCFLHLPFASMAANLVHQKKPWMQQSLASDLASDFTPFSFLFFPLLFLDADYSFFPKHTWPWTQQSLAAFAVRYGCRQG